MLQLITAQFSLAPIPQDAPEEIVYIPVGVHKITPQSHPKGITVSVPAEKGEEIAAALQKDLEKRLSDSVRPRTAFDHSTSGPASGHPKSFRFDPERGIILAIDWSNSGRKAVEGRDYSYFSPTFLIDAKGRPAGLPSRGEIGSLVDEPAFREIGKIAASDSTEETNPTQPPKIMKLLLAALNISPDSADAETAGVTAVNALKETASRVPTLQAKVTELEGKVTASENALKETRKATGEALFARAVTAGLAKKEDDAVKAEYVEAAASDNKLAIKFLTEHVEAAEKDSKPAAASRLSKPLVAASRETGAVQAGEHAFVIEARKRITAGLAKTESEAFGIVASERPELYEAYNEQFAVGF